MWTGFPGSWPAAKNPLMKHCAQTSFQRGVEAVEVSRCVLSGLPFRQLLCYIEQELKKHKRPTTTHPMQKALCSQARGNTPAVPCSLAEKTTRFVGGGAAVSRVPSENSFRWL